MKGSDTEGVGGDGGLLQSALAPVPLELERAHSEPEIETGPGTSDSLPEPDTEVASNVGGQRNESEVSHCLPHIES